MLPIRHAPAETTKKINLYDFDNRKRKDQSHFVIERKQIQVCGMVQSVGFRPFVYALAERYGLNGCVRNNERGVLLDLENQKRHGAAAYAREGHAR